MKPTQSTPNDDTLQKLSDNDIDNIFQEIDSQQTAQQVAKKDVDWNDILKQTRNKKIGYLKNLFLSKEMDVNCQNPSDGKTLLIYAVIVGDKDLVTSICNFGGDAHITDNDGMDSLDYAQKYGRYDITELLYYRTKGSLGNDLKEISSKIHKKNKEAQYMYEASANLPTLIIDFMTKAVKERQEFDESMLYHAWYFVLKKCEKDGSDPFEHKLWRTLITTYEQILCNTSDGEGWKWLKAQFVNSLIWYLPHPHRAKAAHESQDDQTTAAAVDTEEMAHVLQQTLFQELLTRVRIESKKQSDLLLKGRIARIKHEEPDDWQLLTGYFVSTPLSSHARQDLCGSLQPKYNENDLSPDKYPPSTHFSAQKHYDTNIYLNELMFVANILDSKFQNEMKRITQAINRETGDAVEYIAGPVKTLTRSQAKCNNDYIDEAYPTSAKLLDINRCALQCENIAQMMRFIDAFTRQIGQRQTGCIKQVIRCKNGWSVYDENYPQYTDIKLNVLIVAEIDGNGTIVAEIQFLLDLMSSFKKKAHKLYGVERKFELVYNFGLLQQKMANFKDFANVNFVLKEFAENDDLKFFQLLWINVKPTKTTLVNLGDRNANILDNAVIHILISKGGSIHAYLEQNYHDLYRETVTFYLNNHKWVKSWEYFLNAIAANEETDDDKQQIQALFIRRYADFFQPQQTAETAVDLRIFGVSLDLFERGIHAFVNEYKAFNAVVFNTHIYDEQRYKIAVHEQTKFKFVDASFKGGALYVFGNGNKGRLGLGADDSDQPMPVVSTTLNANTLLQIASCNRHALAVDKHGDVYSFGLNDCGQLGNGTTTAPVDRGVKTNKKDKKKDKDKDKKDKKDKDKQEKKGEAAPNTIPKKLPSFCAYKAVHVAVGELHSLVLTEDGKVHSFGYGADGALGHGSQDLDNKTTPTVIKELLREHVTHISCGNEHNCAVTKQGALWVWGKLLADLVMHAPCRMETVRNAVYTASGNGHSLVLTVDGSTLSFGNGYKGKLGHGDEANARVPTVIEELRPRRIVDIGCGWDHSLCVTDDGELYGFGYGQFGQLGVGNDIVCCLTPKKVQYLHDERGEMLSADDTKIVWCEGGATHSAMIDSSGALYMCGKGGHGELGQGVHDVLNKNVPTKVAQLSDCEVASVALGNKYSLVIARNSTSQLQGQSADADAKDNSSDTAEESEYKDTVYHVDVNQTLCVRNQMPNGMHGKRFKVYVQNEVLFHRSDWIMLTQDIEYSPFPYHSNAFSDNLHLQKKHDGGVVLTLDATKIDSLYVDEILETAYMVVLNEQTSDHDTFLKQESIPKEQKIFTFGDAQNVRFEIGSKDIRSIAVYARPNNGDIFMLIHKYESI